MTRHYQKINILILCRFVGPNLLVRELLTPVGLLKPEQSILYRLTRYRGPTEETRAALPTHAGATKVYRLVHCSEYKKMLLAVDGEALPTRRDAGKFEWFKPRFNTALDVVYGPGERAGGPLDATVDSRRCIMLTEGATPVSSTAFIIRVFGRNHIYYSPILAELR